MENFMAVSICTFSSAAIDAYDIPLPKSSRFGILRGNKSGLWVILMNEGNPYNSWDGL